MINSKALEVSERGELSQWNKLLFWWYEKTRFTRFRKYVQDPWYDFKFGVRNLIKWFPLVWRDRDYDDAFIMRALQFKIRDVRDHIVRHGIIAKHQRGEMVRDMTLAIKLIDSFLDERYEVEYQEYIDTEIEFTDYADEDHPKEMGLQQLHMRTLRQNLQEYFDKYPRTHKQVLKEDELGTGRSRNFIRGEAATALRMGMARQEKANRILFELLNARIRRWWC